MDDTPALLRPASDLHLLCHIRDVPSVICLSTLTRCCSPLCRMSEQVPDTGYVRAQLISEGGPKMRKQYE